MAQTKETRAWFTTDEINAWAEKKLKENPQWTHDYNTDTASQQRPWVGLTDEEIHRQTIFAGFNSEWNVEIGLVLSVVRNLEAKLKEKNGG
jgi:hypothetical protein